MLKYYCAPELNKRTYHDISALLFCYIWITKVLFCYPPWFVTSYDYTFYIRSQLFLGLTRLPHIWANYATSGNQTREFNTRLKYYHISELNQRTYHNISTLLLCYIWINEVLFLNPYILRFFILLHVLHSWSPFLGS